MHHRLSHHERDGPVQLDDNGGCDERQVPHETQAKFGYATAHTTPIYDFSIGELYDRAIPHRQSAPMSDNPPQRHESSGNNDLQGIDVSTSGTVTFSMTAYVGCPEGMRHLQLLTELAGLENEPASAPD